jgi:hypothetical protein
VKLQVRQGRGGDYHTSSVLVTEPFVTALLGYLCLAMFAVGRVTLESAVHEPRLCTVHALVTTCVPTSCCLFVLVNHSNRKVKLLF